VILLLDTNAYSHYRGGHGGVTQLVTGAERVVMSAVVVGELLFGFHCGDRRRRNELDLRGFLELPWVELAPVTLATAERFALVAAALRRTGRSIGVNDIWIAAHALEHGADLISFDQHFAAVDGVRWIDPATE
jgi:tRNA(fMet)-specific endonuclease VapC